MKTTTRRRLRLAIGVPTIVLLGILAVGCAPVEEEAAEDPNAVEPSIGDESALNALIADYLVAVNGGDADGVAALYSADAVRMPPNAPPIRGRESIRRNMEETFETATLNVQMQVDETEASGELAYVRGTFLLTATPKDGSPATESQGNWMRLMRREPDGRWLIAYSLWNFPT